MLDSRSRITLICFIWQENIRLLHCMLSIGPGLPTRPLAKLKQSEEGIVVLGINREIVIISVPRAVRAKQNRETFLSLMDGTRGSRRLMKLKPEPREISSINRKLTGRSTRKREKMTKTRIEVFSGLLRQNCLDGQKNDIFFQDGEFRRWTYCRLTGSLSGFIHII